MAHPEKWQKTQLPTISIRVVTRSHQHLPHIVRSNTINTSSSSTCHYYPADTSKPTRGNYNALFQYSEKKDEGKWQFVMYHCLPTTTEIICFSVVGYGRVIVWLTGSCMFTMQANYIIITLGNYMHRVGNTLGGARICYIRRWREVINQSKITSFGILSIVS